MEAPYEGQIRWFVFRADADWDLHHPILQQYLKGEWVNVPMIGESLEREES